MNLINIAIYMVCAVFVVASGQRPSYAGTGPIGRPSLASRFQDSTQTTTVAAVLANRVDAPPLPVDARGDGDLVNRLNEWPREHRPFWLLNAGHIEAARNPTNPPQQQQDVQSRGSFAGGSLPIRPNEPRSSFLGPRTP